MASRSIHQYRPSGDAGASPYSPQRDIANLYSPMLREVFQGLDEENWPPYMRQLYEEAGVTSDDLAEGVKVFMEAIRLFIRDREVHSVVDAFKKAGLQDQHPLIHVAIYQRLGEVFTGGFFVALRDVTMQGEKTAVHTDFVDMLAAGRVLANNLSGHGIVEDELEGSIENLRYKLEIALADRQETERSLEQSRNSRRDLYHEVTGLKQRCDEYSRHIKHWMDITDDVEHIHESGWLSRLYRVGRFALKLYFAKKL